MVPAPDGAPAAGPGPASCPEPSSRLWPQPEATSASMWTTGLMCLLMWMWTWMWRQELRCLRPPAEGRQCVDVEVDVDVGVDVERSSGFDVDV